MSYSIISHEKQKKINVIENTFEVGDVVTITDTNQEFCVYYCVVHVEGEDCYVGRVLEGEDHCFTYLVHTEKLRKKHFTSLNLVTNEYLTNQLNYVKLSHIIVRKHMEFLKTEKAVDQLNQSWLNKDRREIKGWLSTTPRLKPWGLERHRAFSVIYIHSAN